LTSGAHFTWIGADPLGDKLNNILGVEEITKGQHPTPRQFNHWCYNIIHMSSSLGSQVRSLSAVPPSEYGRHDCHVAIKGCPGPKILGCQIPIDLPPQQLEISERNTGWPS